MDRKNRRFLGAVLLLLLILGTAGCIAEDSEVLFSLPGETTLYAKDDKAVSDFVPYIPRGVHSYQFLTFDTLPPHDDIISLPIIFLGEERTAVLEKQPDSIDDGIDSYYGYLEGDADSYIIFVLSERGIRGTVDTKDVSICISSVGSYGKTLNGKPLYYVYDQKKQTTPFEIAFALFLMYVNAVSPSSSTDILISEVLETVDEADVIVLTDEDLKEYPVLLRALKSGTSSIPVYDSGLYVPVGGISGSEYFRILEQFGYRYISFEGVIYVIVSGPVSSGGVGWDNVVSALAKTAGVLVFASAVVLVTVNFFRSVSSAASDSKSMQIQLYIEENPGVGESDIVKGLGYSRGSTVHQLKKLIRDKRVLEKPYHKTVRYYPAESRTREDDVFDAALRREKPAAILSALQKHPMTLSELERETDISRYSLRWHLSRMEENGIILRKEEAGRVFYSLSKEEK